jgi:hypothetical protein
MSSAVCYRHQVAGLPWVWRILTVLIASGVFHACKNSYSALEPEANKDLRVLITINAFEKKAIAGHGNSALRYDLSRVFSAEQSTDAWLLTYSRKTIIEAFPGLSEFTNEEIAEILVPRVDGTGGFPAPEADAVLQVSQINRDSNNISYSPSTWNQWLQFVQEKKASTLRFQLQSEIGCPAGEAQLRVFKRSQPAVVCTVHRGTDCGWKFLDCSADQQSEICNSSATQGEFLQQPNGDLLIGELTCSAQAVNTSPDGLSEIWECTAGVCGNTSVTLASQETPLLTEPSAPSTPWLAVHQLEHQASFSEGDAVYDGKKDVVLTGYEDNANALRFRSYRWIRSQGNTDTVEQREISVQEQVSIDKKDYTKLRSLWMRKDHSAAILNGQDMSYFLRNDSTVSGQISFGKPLKIQHDQSANNLSLSSNPEFVPSVQVLGRFYGVTDQGIAVFDDTSMSVLHTTPSSAGLTFDANQYRMFVGQLNQQEQLVVCALLPPRFDSCGSLLYLFDATANYLGQRSLGGPMKTLAEDLKAIFEKSDFTLGRCNLGETDCELEGDTIYIPAINANSTGASEGLRLSSKSFGGTDDGSTFSSILAVTYGSFAGVVDLGSGLSTAIEIEGHGLIELLAVITNDLAAGNWLLVQGQDKILAPQWVYIPTLRNTK